MPNSMFPAMNVEPSQPWGGNDPFSMMNNLAEFQNRQNMNTMFKLKMQANQAAGEAIANAPDIETGIQNALKIPGVPAYASESLMNYRQMRLLQQQYDAGVQKQYLDGLQATVGAMVPATIADWRQGGTAANAVMGGLSPLIAGKVSKQVKAVMGGLTDGLDDVVKNDPLGPEHGMQTAQNMVKARAMGAYAMGGLDPDKLKELQQQRLDTGGGFANVAPQQGMIDAMGRFVPGGTQLPGGVVKTQAPGYAQQGEIAVGGALGPNGLGITNSLGQGFQSGPPTQQQMPPGQEGQMMNPVPTLAHMPGAQLAPGPAPWVYSTGLPQGALAADGKPLVANSPAMHFQKNPAFVGGISPQDKITNDETAKEFASTDKDAFRAAQQAQAMAHELGDTYDYFAKKTLENGGKMPVEGPGFGAEWRNNFGRIAQFVGQVTGSNKNYFDPVGLGAIETAQKATSALTLSNAKTQVGGQRETNFLLGQVGLTVPGIDNTVLGGKILAELTEANAKYQQDKYNFMNEYRDHNGGLIQPAEGLFAAQHNPQALVHGIMSKYGINEDGKIPPPSVKDLRNKGYLTDAQANAILRKDWGMKE